MAPFISSALFGERGLSMGTTSAPPRFASSSAAASRTSASGDPSLSARRGAAARFAAESCSFDRLRIDRQRATLPLRSPLGESRPCTCNQREPSAPALSRSSHRRFERRQRARRVRQLGESCAALCSAFPSSSAVRPLRASSRTGPSPIGDPRLEKEHAGNEDPQKEGCSEQLALRPRQEHQRVRALSARVVLLHGYLASCSCRRPMDTSSRRPSSRFRE